MLERLECEHRTAGDLGIAGDSDDVVLTQDGGGLRLGDDAQVGGDAPRQVGEGWSRTVTS